MRYAQRLIIVIFALGSVGPVAAERSWTKEHRLIRNPELGVVAEYTYIGSDTAIPFMYRKLLEVEGHLLVIRARQTNEAGSYVMTVESVSTGDTLTIESDFEVEQRLSFGREVLTIPYREFGEYFDSHGDYPPVLRSTAQALLTEVPAEFREALHEVAEIGRYHSIEWSPLTVMLTVFFDDLGFDDPIHEDAPSTSRRIRNFDPKTDPPSAFELRFGQAYYE